MCVCGGGDELLSDCVCSCLLKTSVPARRQGCGSRVREGDYSEEDPQGEKTPGPGPERPILPVIVTAATGFTERAAWSQPRRSGLPHPARSAPADLSEQVSSRALLRPFLPGVLCEAAASLLQHDNVYSIEGRAQLEHMSCLLAGLLLT